MLNVHNTAGGIYIISLESEVDNSIRVLANLWKYRNRSCGTKLNWMNNYPKRNITLFSIFSVLNYNSKSHQSADSLVGSVFAYTHVLIWGWGSPANVSHAKFMNFMPFMIFVI
jgi:hypothetical protein